MSLVSSISVTLPFQWNVLTPISVSKVFSWDVGEGPLYWYVVESHPCLDLCCEVTPTCQNISTTPTTVEIQTIMATSVKHLCERLRELRFNRRIYRIRRWKRPVLECDVRKLEQSGLDQCCNTLVDVDLCECECVGYLPVVPATCSLTELAGKALVWYTEYLHLQDVPVSIGQTVIRGQLLGYVAESPGTETGPHLHWGVGDGVGGGNIGQTIDVDSLFNWPAFNERAAVSGPSSSLFTADEICYVKSTLASPVNRDCCEWGQYYGSTFHTGPEYYAQDLNCIPPEEDLDVPVYVASGGCDVVSLVTDVADLGVGYGVIVKHTKKTGLPITATQTILPFSFAPGGMMGCDFGLGAGRMQVASDKFSSRPVAALQPSAAPLNVAGYVRPVAATLKLTQNLKGKVGEKVPERVPLTYSAVTGSWNYSQHHLADGVHWSVVFALKNVGAVWELQVTLGRSSGGKNRLTRLKFGVQRVPPERFVIGVEYVPATGSLTSNCVVHYKSLADDLNVVREPLTLKVGET